MLATGLRAARKFPVKNRRMQNARSRLVDMAIAEWSYPVLSRIWQRRTLRLGLPVQRIRRRELL